MPDTDDEFYDDGAPTDSDSDDELEIKKSFQESLERRHAEKQQTVFLTLQKTIFVDADRTSLGTITATNELLRKYTLLHNRKN